MSDPDVWLDSDIEYERARREHPAVWSGPPRYTVRCPVCGRGMRSSVYLEAPHWNPNGLKVCSACREFERRISHTDSPPPPLAGAAR